MRSRSPSKPRSKRSCGRATGVGRCGRLAVLAHRASRPTTVVRPCALVDIQTSAPPRHRPGGWGTSPVAANSWKKRPPACRRATWSGSPDRKNPSIVTRPNILNYGWKCLGESRVGASISGLSLRIHCAMTAVSCQPATSVKTHLARPLNQAVSVVPG